MAMNVACPFRYVSAGLLAPVAAALCAAASASAREAFAWQELGATTYAANCAACHQENGEGLPGSFPPLAGHLAEVAGEEGGRDYLINVVLFGLEGEIAVGGQTYNGVMPGWAFLSDEEIAAVINHALTAWGNQEALPADFALANPADVATVRPQTKTAAEVHQLRATVVSPAP
jgi:mono/diheme cytochrome c family protein